MTTLQVWLQEGLESGYFPPPGTLLLGTHRNGKMTSFVILDYQVVKDSDGYYELENEIIIVTVLSNYNSLKEEKCKYFWEFLKQFKTASVPIL
jgi:hypothetical protein